MAGVAIGWDESDPANSKNLGLGAGDIRSMKTNLSGALGAEHVFPTAGGTAGAHAKGSAVVHYGTASAVSSSDTEGRLMITSDTSQLFHVASAVTMRLGGRYVPFTATTFAGGSSATVTPSVGQRVMLEYGTGIMPTSGATNYDTQHTFATSGGLPMVFTELMWSSSTSFANKVIGTSNGATQIQFANFLVSSGASGAPSGGTFQFNFMILGITT